MSATVSIVIFGALFLLLYFIFRIPSGELRLDRQFTNTIKGIAMLLILYHHSGIYHHDIFWYFFFSGWGFCGVSLFFFISGFGLSASYDHNPLGYMQYFKRRLFVLWPTIIICMLLRGVIAPLYEKQIYLESDPLTLLGLHEWYIVAIAVWYILFILITKLSKSRGDVIFFISIISIILWSFLDVLFHENEMAFLWMRFPFSFAMGVIFAKYSDKIIRYVNSRIVLITILTIISIAVSIHLYEQKNLVYPMMDLVFPVLGVCMVLWIYKIGINSKFILYIGKNSLPLYLLQVPIIKYGYLIKTWRHDIVGLIASWALVFLLAQFVVYGRSVIDYLINLIKKRTSSHELS